MKPEQVASVIVRDANIITLNGQQPRAEALAIADGRIVGVGDNDQIDELGDERTHVIDARGKTVLPGFIDSHSHLFFGGVVAEAVDLTAARTIGDIVRSLSERAAVTPTGEWIRGYGFCVDRLAERRHPKSVELDRATTRHPVWVTSDSFHSSTANSLGFEKIALERDNPGLERSAEGKLTGAYVTDAANIPARQRVFGFLSDADAARMIRLMADVAASKGITTIHAFEGSRMSRDRDFKVLLDTFESLPIRVLPYYETFDLSEIENKKIRGLGGCGRCNLDGMPNTYTAALAEPYADFPDHQGELHYSQERIDSFVLDAYARGVQVGMHAMGDAAIDQLLLSHERAKQKYPNRSLRHRIEHFHIPSASQIARAAELGLVLAVHPIFSHLWGGRGEVFHRRFGEERYRRIDRYRDLIRAGCVVTTGADLPVHPPEPFLWLGLLIENPVDRTQDVSLDEALRITISNGAYAGFEENDKGSLEPGKLADLIVIDRDPYACGASEIRSINVESTLVGGKVVYSRGAEA
jgi:predicted amidohydrolase YtcJ